MKVVVIGSGLIGLTTAWYLHRQGHDVQVLDRQAGPGLETSFANGALLTAGMAEPWNAPGCWRVLLGSLGRSDAALQLRMRALPKLAAWGISFLRNSSPSLFERNVRSNVCLAVYSLRILATLRDETQIAYSRTARGALKLFRGSSDLERAESAAHRDLGGELTFRRLSAEETVALEPALAPIANRLAGALYFPVDEVGDAYRFCVSLAEQACQEGVQFRFGVEITSLERRGDRISAVAAGDERFEADRYVVAAGSYSMPLLRRAGVRLPVQPVKGYSVTLADDRDRPALRIPVIDDELHAVVVPIDGAIRVAGTAEFAGYDLAQSPERVQNLLNLLRAVLPGARLDLAAAKPWCGLRPMSADGVPIIGPTPIANLFVSTGHGHLGWTMAAGSGQLLADLMSGSTPAIDPAPYSLARF